MIAARTIVSASVLAVVGLLQPPAGAAPNASVTVGDSFFDPETVVVEVGSSVTWTQEGNLTHSVTADDSSFDSHPGCTSSVPSSCMRNGDTFSRAFNTGGAFRYYCKIHGGAGGAGMSGVVQVVNELGVVPTTVQGLSATSSGSTLAVSGSAAFGGQPSITVATDPAGDFAAPPELGLDLIRASIGQPDPGTGDLVFSLELAGLPDTGGIPELVRYSWDFAVDRGAGPPTPFEIDGRFTDVIRRQSTRTPSFVLRGSCSSANNQITCTDVAFLDATAEPAADRIRITLPRALLEQQVGGSVDGAVIEPATICEGISSKLGVHSTLCGGQGQQTGDEILAADMGSFSVASPKVDVGIVPAGASPAFTAAGTTAADGSFGSSLDVSGLPPGAYDVWARACFGTNCGTRSVRINL